MFGCSTGPDGIVQCPTQLAYELWADELDAYNQSLAIWKDLSQPLVIPEAEPEDIYGAPNEYWDDEPYLDEPDDPYGLDEGPFP